MYNTALKSLYSGTLNKNQQNQSQSQGMLQQNPKSKQQAVDLKQQLKTEIQQNTQRGLSNSQKQMTEPSNSCKTLLHNAKNAFTGSHNTINTQNFRNNQQSQMKQVGQNKNFFNGGTQNLSQNLKNIMKPVQQKKEQQHNQTPKQNLSSQPKNQNSSQKAFQQQQFSQQQQQQYQKSQRIQKSQEKYNSETHLNYLLSKQQDPKNPQIQKNNRGPYSLGNNTQPNSFKHNDTQFNQKNLQQQQIQNSISSQLYMNTINPNKSSVKEKSNNYNKNYNSNNVQNGNQESQKEFSSVGSNAPCVNNLVSFNSNNGSQSNHSSIQSNKFQFEQRNNSNQELNVNSGNYKIIDLNSEIFSPKNSISSNPQNQPTTQNQIVSQSNKKLEQIEEQQQEQFCSSQTSTMKKDTNQIQEYQKNNNIEDKNSAEQIKVQINKQMPYSSSLSKNNTNNANSSKNNIKLIQNQSPQNNQQQEILNSLDKNTIKNKQNQIQQQDKNFMKKNNLNQVQSLKGSVRKANIDLTPNSLKNSKINNQRYNTFDSYENRANSQESEDQQIDRIKTLQNENINYGNIQQQTQNQNMKEVKEEGSQEERKKLIDQFLRNLNGINQKSETKILQIKQIQQIHSEKETINCQIQEVQRMYQGFYQILENEKIKAEKLIYENQKQIDQANEQQIQNIKQSIVDMKNIKSDIEQNLENILVNMDFKPFINIITKYTEKLNEYDNQVIRIVENKGKFQNQSQVPTFEKELQVALQQIFQISQDHQIHNLEYIPKQISLQQQIDQEQQTKTQSSQNNALNSGNQQNLKKTPLNRQMYVSFEKGFKDLFENQQQNSNQYLQEYMNPQLKQSQQFQQNKNNNMKIVDEQMINQTVEEENEENYLDQSPEIPQKQQSKQLLINYDQLNNKLQNLERSLEFASSGKKPSEQYALETLNSIQEITNKHYQETQSTNQFLKQQQQKYVQEEEENQNKNKKILQENTSTIKKITAESPKEKYFELEDKHGDSVMSFYNSLTDQNPIESIEISHNNDKIRALQILISEYEAQIQEYEDEKAQYDEFIESEISFFQKTTSKQQKSIEELQIKLDKIEAQNTTSNKALSKIKYNLVNEKENIRNIRQQKDKVINQFRQSRKNNLKSSVCSSQSALNNQENNEQSTIKKFPYIKMFNYSSLDALQYAKGSQEVQINLNQAFENQTEIDNIQLEKKSEILKYIAYEKMHLEQAEQNILNRKSQVERINSPDNKYQFQQNDFENRNNEYYLNQEYQQQKMLE
ncbi:hypothetical protein PPERSA_08221 [Pseudocohnilembus persalinus]|uniref:Uncharacterized protein n=1 Tax=Pseudocohnilembus persalinus TaxID=266149 RepID=A0A0V0QGA5_PSEPJ|nr:hypothetical protein PPERSA_08221 [Pseudocohnilembus persalinus]|eukprot:KRX01120.1 hypothetical protein PPERSA_08221 [Pseudocohnilembus persalinus]